MLRRCVTATGFQVQRALTCTCAQTRSLPRLPWRVATNSSSWSWRALSVQRSALLSRRVVLAAQRAHAVLPSPATVPQGRRKRRWWARERSACWWDTEAQDFDDKEFRSNFRMCWETFYFIADTIRPQIQRQDTTWRPALGFQRVTAMALYRLATGAHNAAL